MTKANLYKLAFFLTLSLTVISCKKEEVVDEVVTATINVTEPSSTDTIVFNDELHIEGTISGSAELHGYTISYINTSSNAVLKTVTYDVHSSSYNFHEHWVNNVLDTTIVKAKIDVTKDHDGNHEIKEVNVVCLPQ
jgi:hypothetical protein